MSSLPIVAIIGRPNAGKSALFNRIVGTRKAVESPLPGTTRDHVIHRVNGETLDYLLLDTGGIGGGSKDREFEKDVEAQSYAAVEQADCIVLALSGQDEITAADREAVKLLRKRKRSHVPVILALTKCDNARIEAEALSQGYELCISDRVIGTSAAHSIGIAELCETIEESLTQLNFTRPPLEEEPTTIPRIAIVGKPNVGKSSLLNALMSEPQRARSPRLVSAVAGTTRDSSDSLVQCNGRPYILTDTAGLRRGSKRMENIEALCAFRALAAMEQSDAVLLLVDGAETTTRQDQRIAADAIEMGKALVIVLTKSDRMERAAREEKEQETLGKLRFAHFAPTVWTSAETKEGLLKLFPLIDLALVNRTRRIAAGDLRTWFRSTVQQFPASALAVAKHITQADSLPPTFVIFSRRAKDVSPSQIRTLENALRSTFAFEGTPVRWVLRTGQDEKRR